MIEKELSIGWTLREVKAGLEVYNRGQLDRHIKPYTKAFLAGEKKWLLKQESRIAKATDMALVVAKTKQTTKAAALTYNAVPFLHPDCFKRFVKYLPKDAQAILEHVVLSGPIGHREVEERFGVIGSIQATKKDWRGVYPRLESPEFQFYMSNDPYSYYSFSDDDIIYTLPATVRLLISPLLLKFILLVRQKPDLKSKNMRSYLRKQ